MHPKEGGGGELRASEAVRRRREVMLSVRSNVSCLLKYRIRRLHMAMLCLLSDPRA